VDRIAARDAGKNRDEPQHNKDAPHASSRISTK
jgi:hypothetical protein